MSWSCVWPWSWLRGKASPARRSPSLQLAPDLLEDRLLPSATSLDYQSWRSQSFHVDDVPLAANLATASPGAASVPQNNSFGSLIGLPTVFGNYPYTGAGSSVAVIDTGIDYRHADLGGGFGVGKRVIAGWDFVNNDADPLDDNGHGTHVAGIIGSSSATYSGVAPNVNLIALKVLSSTGSGTFGAVEDALQWVLANRAKYNIVAVNLSLGSGNYTTNPYTFLDDEFSNLKNAGTFISVAAGNSFYSNNSAPGLDFPAVNPYVVSVGATWSGNFGPIAWGSGARDLTTAADRVASFSQRGPALSIMAPGALITSTYLDNTYKSMAGTSMAAPVIAGAAALLHQAMTARGMTANQDTILNVMKSTGVSVFDGDDENDNVTNTGLSFKRINLGAAMASIGVTNSAPVLQPMATQTIAPGSTLTLTLSATDPNGDAISYSARVLDNSPPANQLGKQLGLAYAGSYFQNSWGQNEKWLTGAGGVWYCILPNGQLRRWAGSMAATLLPVNLVGTLDVKYYTNPSLLLNGSSTTTLPQVSVVGNQLRIQAPAILSGSFQIEVTASDGKLASVRTFTLTTQTSVAPRINALATQTVVAGQSVNVALSAQAGSKPTLTYSASLVGSPASSPATLSINGTQLTINAAAGFVGSFTVQVTVSDGSLSSSTTFRVDVTAPPSAVHQLTGDFNGDGRQDIARMFADGSWQVSLRNTNGTFTNQTWAQWSAASNWSYVATGDFNGDGKTDVIGFSTGGAWWVGVSTGAGFTQRLFAQWSSASNWSTVRVGDFNGDGKTDIAGFTTAGSWWVGVSSGTTFATTLWTQWSAASNWTSIQFRDVDGDGKLDLVGLLSLTSKWYVGYSTGTGFRIQAM